MTMDRRPGGVRRPDPTLRARTPDEPAWPDQIAGDLTPRDSRYGGGRPVPNDRPRIATQRPNVDTVRRAAGPLLAAIGLVVVGWLTFAVLTGDVPIPGGPGGGTGPAGQPTAAPSNVVIVDPRVNVPGSIVYVKAGNVWVQSGTGVRQLTTTGTASMASWSPDGSAIYYVDTATQKGLAPIGGGGTPYVMSVPSIMRIAADGSGQPQRVYSSLMHDGRYTWSYWIRDPVVSPDGRTLAMASDARNPATTDVVIQLLDLQSQKLTKPKLAENSPLGHQDPAWRPDGRALLYVKNARDGARGTPAIYRYDVVSGKSTALTGPGYLAPAWSRDGRFVAATRTDSFGTNVVILDARNGTELLRLTSDGDSWSPVWSPKGDAIAYLHVEGQIIDLRMIPLTGDGPNWTPGKAVNLTDFSGLDGASHPGWFVPPNQLPPLPSASPSATGSGAPSGSPSASPAGSSSAP